MKNERLLRYGATFTAAAALGGLSLKSAEAQPLQNHALDKITQSDKQPALPNYPAGIKTIGNELAKQKEMGEALKHMNQRFEDIVFVLHAPKERDIVGLGTSPSAYDNENGYFTMLGPQAKNVVIIPQPGRVMFRPKGSKVKREYAVIYDTERKPAPSWEFLDIAYAQQSGALDIYKVKGKKAGLAPYPLEAQEADLPAVGNPIDFGPSWMNPETHKGLLSIWLPTNIDVGRKLYNLEPLKALPTH